MSGIIVAASLALGIVVLSIMPPLPVVVRRARPILSTWGLLAWILYRLLSVPQCSSLLQLWVQALVTAQHYLAVKVAESPYATLVQPALVVVWRLAEDFMALILFLGMYRILYCLYHYSLTEWKDSVVGSFVEWATENVPVVKSELAKETDKFSRDAEQILHKDPHRIKTLALPDKGRSQKEILVELQEHVQQEDVKWKDGRVSGTVYANDVHHSALLNQVYGIYAWSNPLHPGYWPKLNQCEAEVIAMTSNMLHGPPIGSITSGGTESILLAVRAHLNYYGKRRGIVHPEIVCGTTAHAALNKACDIFGIRQVIIDCSPTSFQLDPTAVRRHVTSNTIMIYASAPCYPQGTVDPIPDLSDVAMEYDIGLHVDACLGGFVLPFVDDAPVFDFRCPGVSSMSADTHKYGLCSKGTSVVMYKNNQLRHGQYFSYPKWTGGLYCTPTFAGSRSGALSACAWAALVSIGQEGYRSRAESIVQAARALADGIQAIPGLKLLTPKPYMVVCVGSDVLDIYRILDVLTTSGWSLTSLQSPPCMHLCVTLNTVPNIKLLLDDLHKAVEQVRKEGDTGRKKSGTAGIYGTVGSAPEGPVAHVLRVFTDATLSP